MLNWYWQISRFVIRYRWAKEEAAETQPASERLIKDIFEKGAMPLDHKDNVTHQVYCFACQEIDR